MGKSPIRWRPLTTVLLLIGVTSILVAIIVSYMASSFQPKTEVVIGSQPYRLTVADNDATRQKGLSGVEELKKDGGLLMVFDEDDFHGIWMKDMLIPLDIVWLDANQSVVHIVQGASPELKEGTIFTPKKLARYVIEIPSGDAKRQGLRVGHKLDFDHGKTSLWW